MNWSLIHFGAFFLCLTMAGAGCTWLVRKVCNRLGIVHRSKGIRWSHRIVALGGGIGFLVPGIIAGYWLDGYRSLPLLACVFGVACLGFWDDLFTISPKLKMGLVTSGFQFPIGSPLVSSLISVFWIVGICNSFNLLDNMDGIAGGVAATILMGASFVFSDSSIFPLLPALAMAAAVLGFLTFNFSPASIFMGDTGSLALGLFVAATLTKAGPPLHLPVFHSLAVAALICFVPIFDTTLVTLSRFLAGRKISDGGRDHCTHRLATLGFSERTVALFLYSASILAAVAAKLILFLDGRLALAAFGFLAIPFVLGLYFFIRAEEPKSKSEVAADTANDWQPLRANS
jgi:UDP-GlcNAc:undecaprenyl-phosphate GlcNAc-1-phosphate transferase